MWKNKALTESQIEQLKSLAGQRISVREAAEIIGTSRFIAKEYLNRLGVSIGWYTDWNEESDKLLIDLYNKKTPMKDIMLAVKRGAVFVKKRLAHFGLSLRKSEIIMLNKKLFKEGKFHCYNCHEVHDLDNAVNENKNLCASCQKTLVKIRYVKFKENISFDSLVRKKLSQANSRALKYDFNIDLTHIKELFEKQSGKCYYSNIPMTISINDKFALSIDRKDSSKGYTKDNVVLTCWAVNSMKNNLSKEDFINICKQIAQHNQ